MTPEEYNRKFRRAPGSPLSSDEPVQTAGEVVIPVDADERERRRQIEEAGFDYGGEEAWAEFMQRMGRL